MMFTSYAQNFEDVILWRALKHVDNGYYIDVGAQDPVSHSVSRGFYEKGWRGVNVEPTPSYAQKLRDNRPDEMVLQVAVGETENTIKFFHFPDTGLSTASAEVAELHRESGFKYEEIEVETVSLSSIFRRVGERPIHWLKIDVEGMEHSVIKSWGDSAVRPWIVVVEATEPLSQKLSHVMWDGIIQNYGYQFVYFDGLNRFYVSNEHPELTAYFGPGANVFDEFKLAESTPYVDNSAVEEIRLRLSSVCATAEAQDRELSGLREDILQSARSVNYLTDVIKEQDDRIAESERKREKQAAEHERRCAEILDELAACRTELETVQQHNRTLETELSAAETERESRALRVTQLEVTVENERLRRLDTEATIRAVYCSSSWRLTAPLRGVKRATSWVVRGTLAWLTFKSGSRPHRVLKNLVLHSMLWIRLRPSIAHFLIGVLRKFPGIERRVRLIYNKHVLVKGNVGTNLSNRFEYKTDEIQFMSPRALKVLSNIDIKTGD